MLLWQQVRTPLIAATFVGVIFTVGRLIIDPNAVHQKVNSFTFPSEVPLHEGQLRESQPLMDTVAQLPRQYNAAIAGRYYRYTQKGVFLDLEMRYMVGTLGDVESFIKNYTAIHLPSGQVFQTLRQQEGVGFYGLFVYQNRAYLSTCINPNGGSTVTTEQFLHNRHTYDLRFSRLLPWFLGQESLRDRRCLWVHLSTPLKNADSLSAYLVLEKAWFYWYSWWMLHFPKTLSLTQERSYSKKVALS